MLKKIIICILVIVVVAALMAGISKKDSNLEPEGSEDLTLPPIDEESKTMPYSITFGPASKSRIALDPGDAEDVVYNSAASGFTIQKVDKDPSKYSDDNFAIRLQVEPNTTYKLIWLVDGYVMAARPSVNCFNCFGYSLGEPTAQFSEWLGRQDAYMSGELGTAIIETGDNTELYFYLFLPDDGVGTNATGNIADLLLVGSFADDVQFVLIKQG